MRTGITTTGNKVRREMEALQRMPIKRQKMILERFGNHVVVQNGTWWYMVVHGGTHCKKTIIRNHTVAGGSGRSGSSKEKGREAVCVN